MVVSSSRFQDVAIRGDGFHLRVAPDRPQRAPPVRPHTGPRRPIGRLSVAGERLAEAMHGHDIDGKRILELDCGIGLASLVLQNRHADVVASDMHPLAEPFLVYNAHLNGLPAVRFRHVDWARRLATLGRFDLIIASDAMRSLRQAAALAAAIGVYACDSAEIVVTDAGHGHAGEFVDALAARGFWCTGPTAPADTAARERILMLSFRRGHAVS